MDRMPGDQGDGKEDEMDLAETGAGKQAVDTMDSLMDKIDKAFEDLECGRVRTVDEAWDRIDLLLGV